MRIALCLEYPIEQFGGTEILARELIRGLPPRHEIILVSDDSAESLQKSSVVNFVHKHLRWQPTDATLESSKRLANQLARENIHLAHFHFGGTFGWGVRLPGFSPAIHLSRLGVPCIATNHGVFGLFDGYVGASRSLFTKLALLPFAWLSRMQLISHLRAEIAVSDHDLRALRRRFWPQRRKFRRIYHSRIHENDAVKSGVRTKTILCAGTIGPRKGQPYLAKAFARIAGEFADWELVFIGRAGDERTSAELSALLEQEESLTRARWLPACSDEELKGWLSSVEIFAMPSMHEGLGLSLQEALFYRCACIATRIGGIRDLIQHEENGILVERANVNALAEGLARLMRDNDLRERLRARAHNSILEKGMTAERMVACYEEFYRATLQP